MVVVRASMNDNKYKQKEQEKEERSQEHTRAWICMGKCMRV
jgi:hypothetical protein